MFELKNNLLANISMGQTSSACETSAVDLPITEYCLSPAYPLQGDEQLEEMQWVPLSTAVLWGLRTPSVAYFELMPTQTHIFFTMMLPQTAISGVLMQKLRRVRNLGNLNTPLDQTPSSPRK